MFPLQVLSHPEVPQQHSLQDVVPQASIFHHFLYSRANVSHRTWSKGSCLVPSPGWVTVGWSNSKIFRYIQENKYMYVAWVRPVELLLRYLIVYMVANNKKYYYLILQDYLENHLVRYLPKMSDDQHALVLYDDHTSHVSDPLISWARERNNILNVCSSPTHITCPSTSRCGSVCELHVLLFTNICELACKAYAKASTPANIISAFRKTGIQPFDPSHQLPLLSLLSDRGFHMEGVP